MKKINRFLLIPLLAFLPLFSTNASFESSMMIMEGDYTGISFEKFLEDVAVVYGVHSQLALHERVHIAEFDKLVKDAKEYLLKEGYNFIELAGDVDFLLAAGRARMCPHVMYPQVGEIFGVKVPNYKKLDVAYNGTSLKEAIEEIKEYIY